MSQGNTRQRPSSRTASPPPRHRGPGGATLAVVFLAFFALALAVLLRGFVAERLLVAPADQYSKAVLQAPNATYVDGATGTVRRGATLTLTSTLRGDVKAAKDDTVVWDTFLVLEDLQNQAKVEISESRLAFDRRTAAMVNCCGGVNVPAGGGPVYGLFFPIGVEKKTYAVYDTSTKKAWPMRFEGTENRDGRELYRYSQQVDETNLGQYRSPVPSTLLGLPGKARNVTVDRWYRATVTSWIDPRSGITVDRRQQITSTLKGQNGQGQLVVADLDLRMDDATRKSLGEKADSAAASALYLRTIGPASALGVSVLLFLLAAVLLVRRRRARSLANEPF
ncbi:DUF3068 domain-containing protein [Spirillospora sp. NPDC029432]|uniref:DUF3068 domain-containing protein n=1 Tax=Spirillospora sp. NPDC029432 TaxID=3154599 RepID=UPI003454FB6D